MEQFLVESSVIYAMDFSEGWLPIYHLIDLQRGLSGEVEFDFCRFWDFHILNEHSFFKYEYDFVHVHPPGYGTQYSAMDYKCMRQFLGSLGRKIKWRFLIVVFENGDQQDVSCETREHFLESDGSVTSWIPEKMIGHDFLKMLKLLSYGEVD